MGQHAPFRFATAIVIARVIVILSLPAVALPADQGFSFGAPVGADSEMAPHQTPTSRAMDVAAADNVGTPGQIVSIVPTAPPPFQVKLGDSVATVTEERSGWSYPSDVRMKKDVEDIGYGLSFIRQLRPVQYKLKQGNERYDFGFIAQEIEFVLGDDYNVVIIGSGPDRMLSLRYTDFIAPLVKAVQEQQAMIEELRAEIAALKRKEP